MSKPTPPTSGADTDSSKPRDFVRDIVAAHVEEGRYPQIVTRFPPEPNGYPTIGHAKSICLNFGIADEFGGVYNLRFDDTNPETEEMRYVEAFIRDIKWLGFDWGDRMFFASDYFEQLYEFALILIDKGLAYVDSSTDEEIREARGSVTEPGTNSPFRDRTIAENRDLFERMRAGEFGNGEHVLRAKIDMAHPNMVMRDPILWRIRHSTHYRLGDAWCIYPLYDFTHGLSDAIEGISHSVCTLEFENNREIYDWLVDNVGFEEPRPHQYEFARLYLEYTVVSKRKLLRLVNEGHVAGWDDPRMPTLSGLRRRGVTPEAIRAFCDMIGVTKVNTRIDLAKLEFAIRDDLNTRVPRVMAVSDPLKVVITNWPEGKAAEELEAPLYPHDVPLEGSRTVPFGGELWIERSDFAEDPPKGFRRLSPGGEVRLRYAYLLTCDSVVRNDAGNVVELRCTYDPETLGRDAPDGRKVKGTIHWVAAEAAVPCEFRLYDRLFKTPDPEDVPEGEDWIQNLNPESLVTRFGWVEPSIADDPPGSRYQFERLGYFVSDTEDSAAGALVFNRTVTLRDSWSDRSKSEDDHPHTSAGSREAEAPDPVVEAHDPEAAALARDRTGEEAKRFMHLRGLGLAATNADVLAREPDLGAMFDAGHASGSSTPDGLAKFMVNEVRPRLAARGDDTSQLNGDDAATLVGLVEAGTVTARIARDVLDELIRSGGNPVELAKERTAERVVDPAVLKPLIDELLAQNTEKATALKGGKDGLRGFFVGQVMRSTGGKAAPDVVQALLTEALDAL